MVMKKLFLMFSFVSLVAVGVANAAGDAEAGKVKSAMCLACHGPDGNSPVPMFPKIAGQHAGYITKQLKEFKTAVRKNDTMLGMSAGLTEEDMANLAAFYASQKASVGQAAAEQVAAGKTVYTAGNAASGVAACAACHGPSGAGNPQAGFPGLSGQHASYTETQLKSFRSGQRINDASSMMRSVAAKMTDAEIAAVAQYIQGLH